MANLVRRTTRWGTWRCAATTSRKRPKLLLRKGELGAAVDAARKSLEVDAKFLRGNLRLGDALLLQGNPLLARKAYSAVLSSPDPSEHHEAALRLSRSRLFEGLGLQKHFRKQKRIC
jgi:hypothetical protein